MDSLGENSVVPVTGALFDAVASKAPAVVSSFDAVVVDRMMGAISVSTCNFKCHDCGMRDLRFAIPCLICGTLKEWVFGPRDFNVTRANEVGRAGGGGGRLLISSPSAVLAGGSHVVCLKKGLTQYTFPDFGLSCASHSPCPDGSTGNCWQQQLTWTRKCYAARCLLDLHSDAPDGSLLNSATVCIEAI